MISANGVFWKVFVTDWTLIGHVVNCVLPHNYSSTQDSVSFQFYCGLNQHPEKEQITQRIIWVPKFYLGLINEYSKTCVKRPISRRSKIVFQDQLSLNAGQKYCRMLQGTILQYFRPSLSYHLSLKSLFCLFLSGHFT